MSSSFEVQFSDSVASVVTASEEDSLGNKVYLFEYVVFGGEELGVILLSFGWSVFSY